MRTGLEGSRVNEALGRFGRAYPRTFWALFAAVQWGMIAAIVVPLCDPWEGMMVLGRVSVFAVIAAEELPRYAVAVLRAWRGPDRLMWLGGLAAHLTWFGLAMAGGPNVGVSTVFLMFAAATYIEEKARERAGKDRPGAAGADHGLRRCDAGLYVRRGRQHHDGERLPRQ